MLTFASPGGLEVLVGRDARENDALTFGAGSDDDLWFHAHDVPGAHVVMRHGAGAGSGCVRFAASLALRHSKATPADRRVDVCFVRDVVRPKRARHGMVEIGNAWIVVV